VPFAIANPKAVVALYSKAGMGNDTLPKEVKGIRVNHRVDALFFLQSAAYTGGQKTCVYRIHYVDGSHVDVPITEGQQVLDWWADPERYAEALARNGAMVAWQGDVPLHKGVCVICYEWPNPNPDREIRDVDFLADPITATTPSPFSWA